MTLIIEERHARQFISMPEAMHALRDMYAQDADGDVIEADRSNLILPNGFMRIMAAAAVSRGLAGFKEFHRVDGRVRYSYHLIDTASGELLAVLDAGYLTLLRTGACGGIGIDLLARPDSRVLGVIGSGAEARSQIAAALAVRPIERVQVFSRTAERREKLCAELSGQHDIETVACDVAQDALAGADVIVVATATGGRGPALLGEWLDDPGVHINSIGSTLPSQREIDEYVWDRCHRIVIDAQLLLSESGDAIAATQAGTLDPRDAVLLRDVVAGRAPAREDAAQVTLYKSVGSALQDLAVAAWVYERAAADGGDYARLDDFQSVATVTG